MPTIIALFFAAATPDATFELSRRPLSAHAEARVSATVVEAGTSRTPARQGDLQRQVRLRANDRSTVEFE